MLAIPSEVDMTLEESISALNSALSYFSKIRLVGQVIRGLEEEASKTGRIEPVIRAFELLRFERLIIFLEELVLFAPDNSEARNLAEALLPHFLEARKLLEHYAQDCTQEVE